MNTTDLAARLDETLRVDAYADLDASANGLQVGRDGETIERVAVAVDAVAETVAAAVERDADLLVAHHGLSWDGIERVTGRQYGRIAPLIEADVGLYVAHLPLDGHPEFGNAAGVADVLSLGDREPFGSMGPETIGIRGRLPAARSGADLHDALAAALDHGGQGVRHLDFGPDAIEDVAIVTGAGADWFDEAVAADVDAFVTGEGKGRLYHEAREAGIAVFLGGHYATETFGVSMLADLVEKWGIETTRIDAPTGL